jgi:hypothetical protein
MKKAILQFFTVLAFLLPSVIFAQINPEEGKNNLPTLVNSNQELQQKHKISAAEFLLLPAEKQLHIRNNPNLYVLDESIDVVIQRPIRHRIKRAEYDIMPASRKAHIDANLDKYEIVD